MDEPRQANCARCRPLPSRPSPAGSKSVRGPCCSGRERPSLCGQRPHVLVSQDLFRAAVACGPSTSTRSKPKPGSGRRRLSPCLTRGPLDAEQTTAHQRQEARCLQLKCVHALDMDGNASIFDADAHAKAIQLIKRWGKRVECFFVSSPVSSVRATQPPWCHSGEAYAVATVGLGEWVGPLDAESSSLRTWITLGYSGPACNHRPKVDRLKAHRTDSSNPNLGRQCI